MATEPIAPHVCIYLKAQFQLSKFSYLPYATSEGKTYTQWLLLLHILDTNQIIVSTAINISAKINRANPIIINYNVSSLFFVATYDKQTTTTSISPILSSSTS